MLLRNVLSQVFIVKKINVGKFRANVLFKRKQAVVNSYYRNVRNFHAHTYPEDKSSEKSDGAIMVQ